MNLFLFFLFLMMTCSGQVWNRPNVDTPPIVLTFMEQHQLTNCYVSQQSPYAFLKCKMNHGPIYDFQVLVDPYFLFRPLPGAAI